MFDVNVVGLPAAFVTTRAPGGGWRLGGDRVENCSVQWHETLADWHRVERTPPASAREVDDLLDRGGRSRPPAAHVTPPSHTGALPAIVTRRGHPPAGRSRVALARGWTILPASR
jgi:hypothetical protein